MAPGVCEKEQVLVCERGRESVSVCVRERERESGALSEASPVLFPGGPIGLPMRPMGSEVLEWLQVEHPTLCILHPIP